LICIKYYYINDFLSFSVGFLNNLFASFANKFFFIRKSDIDNNFEIIIYFILLFAAIAICAGYFTISSITLCIVVLAYIILNNYNTIRGKIVDRLYLLINIGIITFICSSILFILCCLFAFLAGVHLEFTFSDIYDFFSCLFGFVLSTILLCNVIYDNITMYYKYSGIDYINKVLAYFVNLLVSLSILALLSMVFSFMLSSVLFVFVSFVSVDFNDFGILMMDGGIDSGNGNSGGVNQSGGNESGGPSAPNGPAMFGNSDNSPLQQNNNDPTIQDFKNARNKIENRVFDYVDYDPKANQFAPTSDPNNDLNAAEKEAVIWARNDVISGTGEVMPEACKR
jgi:hypothetical protein